MEDFLSMISDFFTVAVNCTTNILDVVVGHPALTVLVLGFPIVGFCFGLLKRLIRM